MRAFMHALDEWMKQDPCPECGHNRAAHNSEGCTMGYCRCKIDYGIYDPDPVGSPFFFRADDLSEEEAQEILDKITGEEGEPKKGSKKEGKATKNNNE
jgi:hypothetical protein